MSRVSKFYLLGLLALFSSSAFSEDSFYAYQSDASAACSTKASTIYQSSCSLASNNSYRIRLVVNYVETFPHYFYYPCSFGGLVNDGGVCVVPPPTPEECAARPDVLHKYSFPVGQATLPPNTVTNDGCSYTYADSDSASRGYDCFLAVDGVTMICNVTYGVSGATSSSPTDYNDDNSIGSTSDGGEKSTSNSNGLPVIETDTPIVGDTTTTQTQTENTTYDDQTVIDNKSTSVDITTLNGGDITKTTTTETVQHADGSSDTTITTEYTQNDTTTQTTTLDANAGTTATSSNTIKGSSGTTTTTTSTDSTGTTTGETTTNTGSGGDGNENGRDDDQEGSCLDDQSCNSDIDSSSATDAIDGLFDSAVATVTGDNVGSNDFLGNFLAMPSGTCSNPSFSHSSALGSFNKTIDICTKSAALRDGLGWMFYILTIIAIYRIASRT